MLEKVVKQIGDTITAQNTPFTAKWQKKTFTLLQKQKEKEQCILIVTKK